VSAVDKDPGADVGLASGRAEARMQIHLLGPVEVSSDNGNVVLGGPKPRALLAMLALDAGSTVSADRLIDGLWGDEPPATAAKMVQVYVSQLRKAMAALGEDDAIATHGRGYQLQLGRDRVDAGRFERLLAQGAAREALSLWRGPPLADVADEPFAAPEIRRLDELRASAIEVAIDQDLDAGRHREVLPELEALLAQEPLRERPHAQRMLALYRAGRQAEALEAYRQARATLVEQIGVEPGPELRRLHEAILRQDPSLDPRGREPAGAPLVGRDAELARLRGLWRRACAGAGTSVLVTGPPGIGKTRLVREFAEEVRRDGGAVAYDELEDVRGPTLLVLDDVAQAPEVPPDRPVLAVATAVEGEGETLPLAALARDDVAALARYHAGPRAAVEPAVDRLVAESGGVPARVHRAAAAWARAVATQRVGAAAARASAERTDWHLAGDDVATEVVELQTVRERAQLEGSDAMPVCPFKGLASFDVEDAPVFFGRERLVADMIARLAATRLMGVVGPSGSGKSSALRAGLLATLADGVLPGSERWPRALIRPGAHPLAALEAAIAELPGDERLIVAVDQFEEAFTACRDEAERAAFVDALVACARDTRRRALVLIAVRADFYGHCAGFSELSRLLGANQVLVGPMRRHELRRAIELPARRAGLRVEPELVDALLADVEGEPGALPLLSTALLELWQQRDGRRLALSVYEHTGGVRGAVARLAEGACERLDSSQRDAARRILLRLAGDGGVRVRVPIVELPGDSQDVLSVLASDRLITIGEGEVEVAHEALLREWPRLRTWLEEDAEGRRLHQHLIHAARDWEAAGRDSGELYRGARLASTLDWARDHEGDLNELERDFLDESRAKAEHEAEHQRRSNRRLRVLLAGLAGLLAFALVAGVVALNQRGEARDAARVADAQRLGVLSLSRERLDQALLFSRTSVELDESPATRGSLLSVLLRAPAAVGVVGHGSQMNAAALSPDGSLMATGDQRGAVTVSDAATRQPLGKPYWIQGGFIQQLRFSPDGRTLAVSSLDPDDRAHNAVVDLVDPRDQVRRLRVKLPPLREAAPYVVANVSFLPNGGDLVVRQVHGDYPDGPASPLYRVDGKTGAVTDRLRVGRYTSSWYASETSDRERIFLTSPRDNRTWELDPEPLRVERSWPVGDSAGAVSPDGRMFALASEAGRVRLLDLSSGQIRQLQGRHDGAGGIRFTPDGRTLLTEGEGQVLAWDVERGGITQRFAGHAGGIDALDMTRDGRTLITAGADSRAILWDLEGDRRLDRRFAVGRRFDVIDAPRGIAVSPDGRTLALTHSDGVVDLVDTRTLRRRASVHAIDGIAASVAFSPGGRLLAVTGEGGRLTLWNARTLEPAGELRGMRGHSQALAFSPDGRLLAAAEGAVDGPRQPLRVWDVRRRTPTGFRGRTSASSIAFSPNGELIAAAASFRGTDIRDARTGRLVKRFRIGARAGEGDFPRSVAFSPDGELLFVGQIDGAGRMFSTDDWKPVGRRLEAHTERITFPEFAPDGRTLVTASADGTVVLWDVATQKPIGSPLALERDTFTSAVLSRDGSRLYAISTQGEGLSFDMSLEAWKRHACLVAGRELTADEWAEALPDRPYQAVCSSD
jgi:WD40 repeat protein/DNA-binding SARP family transcriptional activator